MPVPPDPVTASVRLRGLVVPGAVCGPLDVLLRPGLTLVSGGEGRGKTALLRLLAGQAVPAAGGVEREPRTPVCWPDPTDAALDGTAVADWLAAQRAVHAGWRAGVETALLEAFALGPHAGKRIGMLSAGSRRKLGHVAAAASGAALTLLDGPFAALDLASCRVLGELLAEAAEGDGGRVWVVADYERPRWLDGVALQTHLQLGE